jgi:hypothetical protein
MATGSNAPVTLDALQPAVTADLHTPTLEPGSVDRFIAARINAVLAINRGVLKTADRNIRAFPVATATLAEVARGGEGCAAAFAASRLASEACGALGVAVLHDGLSLDDIIAIVEVSDARLLETWATIKAGLPAVVFTGE